MSGSLFFLLTYQHLAFVFEFRGSSRQLLVLFQNLISLPAKVLQGNPCLGMGNKIAHSFLKTVLGPFPGQRSESKCEQTFLHLAKALSFQEPCWRDLLPGHASPAYSTGCEVGDLWEKNFEFYRCQTRRALVREP